MRRRFAATLLVAAAGSAAAQTATRPQRAREELFKMVDAYIVSNLEESLRLSDEQFTKILPLVRRLQSDRRDLAQRRQGILLEMRGQLESGRATEARVADLLKDLKAIESEEPATLRKDRDALDASLTPLQQAKLRILEAQVEQRLRELMNRVKAGGGGARQRGLVDPQ